MVWRLLISLPHGGKLKGKKKHLKSISDYFVPLAVRKGCLFVLGGLPDRVFFFSFKKEIFLPVLPVHLRFLPDAHCGLGAALVCTRRPGIERTGELGEEYRRAAGLSVCLRAGAADGAGR